MISKEKIIANAKKYFDSLTNLGFDTEQLTQFLGVSFIEAPLNPIGDMPNAFAGGLIDFLLKTTRNLIKLNDLVPEAKRINKDSLIKVGLLHQIGKAKLFIPCTSEWHKTHQNKLYDYDETLVSMRIGNRSCFYAMSNGINLTEEEFSAILSYGIEDDKMVQYHNTTLGRLLKVAVEMTIIEVK